MQQFYPASDASYIPSYWPVQAMNYDPTVFWKAQSRTWGDPNQKKNFFNEPLETEPETSDHIEFDDDAEVETTKSHAVTISPSSLKKERTNPTEITRLKDEFDKKLNSQLQQYTVQLQEMCKQGLEMEQEVKAMKKRERELLKLHEKQTQRLTDLENAPVEPSSAVVQRLQQQNVALQRRSQELQDREEEYRRELELWRQRLTEDVRRRQQYPWLQQQESEELRRQEAEIERLRARAMQRSLEAKEGKERVRLENTVHQLTSELAKVKELMTSREEEMKAELAQLRQAEQRAVRDSVEMKQRCETLKEKLAEYHEKLAGVKALEAERVAAWKEKATLETEVQRLRLSFQTLQQSAIVDTERASPEDRAKLLEAVQQLKRELTAAVEREKAAREKELLYKKEAHLAKQQVQELRKELQGLRKECSTKEAALEATRQKLLQDAHTRASVRETEIQKWIEDYSKLCEAQRAHMLKQLQGRQIDGTCEEIRTIRLREQSRIEERITERANQRQRELQWASERATLLQSVSQLKSQLADKASELRALLKLQPEAVQQEYTKPEEQNEISPSSSPPPPPPPSTTSQSSNARFLANQSSSSSPVRTIGQSFPAAQNVLPSAPTATTHHPFANMYNRSYNTPYTTPYTSSYTPNWSQGYTQYWH